MSNANSQPEPKSTQRFSLDSWAVMIALAAAILVRAGIIHRIPW